MLGKKDIIALIVTLLIGLFALFSAISMEYDARSNNALVFSLIEFEKSDYVANLELINMMLLNGNLLDEIKEINRRSWGCSFALIYKDSINPDQQLLGEIASYCLIDVNKTEDYISSEGKIVNQSYELRNISDSIKPFEELNQNLVDFRDYSRLARIWKYASWFCFYLGFFIFYIYFLDYIFRRKK